MVRVYRYRLYPSRAQHVAMLGTLWLLRELYNAALQHRSDVYRRTGETISAYTQMRELAGAVSYTHLTLPTTPYV